MFAEKTQSYFWPHNTEVYAEIRRERTGVLLSLIEMFRIVECKCHVRDRPGRVQRGSMSRAAGLKDSKNLLPLLFA